MWKIQNLSKSGLCQSSLNLVFQMDKISNAEIINIRLLELPVKLWINTMLSKEAPKEEKNEQQKVSTFLPSVAVLPLS